MNASWRATLIGAACSVGWVLSSAAVGAALATPPRPERYATDRAGAIDAARLAALDERLAQFERETSNQILVYVDRRLPAGTTLEEFSNAAFNAWAVGQKGKDNGVALFVFVDERKVRFEVGYGLEGAIPDARTVQIRESYLAPRFRAGDFTGGIEQAADQLMKAARGEPFRGTGHTAAEGPTAGPLPPWLWLIPLVGIGAGWLASRGARSTDALAVRGGGVSIFTTGFLSMAAAPIVGDARPVAVGFGVLLLGMAVAVAVSIGKGTSFTGRRRLGLWMVQVSAGMLIGGFGLLCLTAAWDSLSTVAGFAFLFGVPLLALGGLACAAEPLRVLTQLVARTAFVTCVFSLCSVVACQVARVAGTQTAVDWAVVSGLLWIVLTVFARSRGWKVAPAVSMGSTYSGGGRSSGWSSSGSRSSSWSSSSSSGSSFSGGGGRSGGGGSSGSW